jgi:hypothetical protein
LDEKSEDREAQVESSEAKEVITFAGYDTDNGYMIDWNELTLKLRRRDREV